MLYRSTCTVSLKLVWPPSGLPPLTSSLPHSLCLPLSASLSLPPSLCLPLSTSLSLPPSLCLPLSASISLPPSLCLPLSRSAPCSEFNTSADIQLHKWADSHQLAELCAKVHVLCILQSIRLHVHMFVYVYTGQCTHVYIVTFVFFVTITIHSFFPTTCKM